MIYRNLRVTNSSVPDGRDRPQLLLGDTAKRVRGRFNVSKVRSVLATEDNQHSNRKCPS